MDLYDQHLHSYHSFDSKAVPADNVRAAIERGLKGLTFTEHFDTNPNDWKTCVYDEQAYSQTIGQLREEFGDSIFIGKGIEICYQPDQMEMILDHLRQHSFDLVILSVHYFGKEPVHRRAKWEGVDVLEGSRRYLETVLEAVRFAANLHQQQGPVFHVLGHLDLVKRYTQRFFGAYDLSPFGELIDGILKACLEADLIPEMNTSTLRQGLDEPMPSLETFRRYAALGGQAVSLGSDAHRSADIGAGFDHAQDLIRKAGINSQGIESLGIQFQGVYREGERELIPFT